MQRLNFLLTLAFMQVIQWFNYFDISIAVQKTEQGYKCIKYLDGKNLVGESLSFDDLKELELYLLEHPGCPRNEVLAFIEENRRNLQIS